MEVSLRRIFLERFTLRGKKRSGSWRKGEPTSGMIQDLPEDAVIFFTGRAISLTSRTSCTLHRQDKGFKLIQAAGLTGAETRRTRCCRGSTELLHKKMNWMNTLQHWKRQRNATTTSLKRTRILHYRGLYRTGLPILMPKGAK